MDFDAAQKMSRRRSGWPCASSAIRLAARFSFINS
jgi:hypothetical protein